jgi:hypothetical protein
MRTSGDIHGPGQAAGVLSVKVGAELLVLGVLHLVNMMIFARFRRRQGAAGYRPAPRRRPGGAPAAPGLTGAPAAPDLPATGGAGTPAAGKALEALH